MHEQPPTGLQYKNIFCCNKKRLPRKHKVFVVKSCFFALTNRTEELPLPVYDTLLPVQPFVDKRFNIKVRVYRVMPMHLKPKLRPYKENMSAPVEQTVKSPSRTAVIVSQFIHRVEPSIFTGTHRTRHCRSDDVSITVLAATLSPTKPYTVSKISSKNKGVEQFTPNPPITPVIPRKETGIP